MSSPTVWPEAWKHFAIPADRGHPFCHVSTAAALSVARARDLATEVGRMVALVEWQTYRCALCGGQGEVDWFVADHCHRTGLVRGLVCRSCNARERWRSLDPNIAQAVAEYRSLPPTTILGLRISYGDETRCWHKSVLTYELGQLTEIRDEVVEEVRRLEKRVHGPPLVPRESRTGQ